MRVFGQIFTFFKIHLAGNIALQPAMPDVNPLMTAKIRIAAPLFVIGVTAWFAGKSSVWVGKLDDQDIAKDFYKTGSRIFRHLFKFLAFHYPLPLIGV